MMTVRSGARMKLESALLMRAQRTWMPQAPELEMLILSSCDASRSASVSPKWFTSRAGGPTLHFKCFTGVEKLGVSLWRKTATLLQTLVTLLPSKEFYIKMDSDALMLPNTVVRYLTFLSSNSPPAMPLYFGNNRISSREKFCSGKRCMFSSPAWLALQNTINTTQWRSLHGNAYPPEGQASYAQGGFYGFNSLAIRTLVHSNCMEVVAEVGRANHLFGPTGALFEDEAVGLCMHLHRIPLITCGCIYDWGLCNINVPSSCRADSNKSAICRLPISMHKLRQVKWYDGWWRLLSSREEDGLSQLSAWEEAHVNGTSGGRRARSQSSKRLGGGTPQLPSFLLPSFLGGGTPA